ncbi:MAG: L-type lectin-domain containing protein [Myxococcota bacterium]
MLGLGTLALLVPVHSWAQTSVEEFELGGSAQVVSRDCIRLTDDHPFLSGSAWFHRPLDLGKPFELRLSLVLGMKDTQGADGIAFVLHPGMGTGWRGEGMGISGLSPSVAIEFDTYQNHHLGDPAEDHLGVVVNGDPFHSGAKPVQLRNLEDGQRHRLRIDWTPETGRLRVYFDDVQRLDVPGSMLEQVFGPKPILHWGMTAATGRLSNDQQICLEELLLTYGRGEGGPTPRGRRRVGFDENAAQAPRGGQAPGGGERPHGSGSNPGPDRIASSSLIVARSARVGQNLVVLGQKILRLRSSFLDSR